MTDQFQPSFLTTLIQAVGIILVAGLLLPMTKVIPGRFLRYWSLGWAVLTFGVFCLFGSFRFPAYQPEFLIGYCLAEYLFGFLLWAGCRDFATGETLRPGHFLAVGPAMVFGVVAPLVLHDRHHLFPFYSVIMGAMFLAALLATWKFRVRPDTPTTGLWLLRASLAGLTILFWHYSVVAGYLLYTADGAYPDYLAFSSLYDVLLQTGLAFGMVLMAADRMREELEEKNRQLAAAGAELAQAARTDALTGLLNRRAFDELLRDGSPGGLAGSLAVIDLNDLKPLNDRHGHSAGDTALQLVARALRTHFRVTDPLFRTGGDEFVVVMVGCPEADLAARMARIDESLMGQRLPGVSGPIDLGIAWGVAGFGATDGLAAAFQRADAAMYACKRERKVVKRGAVGRAGS